MKIAWLILMASLGASGEGRDEVTLPPGAGPGRSVQSLSTKTINNSVNYSNNNKNKDNDRILPARSGRLMDLASIEGPAVTSDEQDLERRRSKRISNRMVAEEFQAGANDLETSTNLIDNGFSAAVLNGRYSSRYSNNSLPANEFERGESTEDYPPMDLGHGIELIRTSLTRSRINRSKTLKDFLAEYSLRIRLNSIADAGRSLVESPRFGFGKNSFLTGFGLGFLAFGLKKLLLPVFIGIQIVKSVLVAMFLPTILSHVGKLVGKGVSSVASGSSNVHHDQVADFEFKDEGTDQDGAGSDMGWATAAIPSQSHATLAALNPQYSSNQPLAFNNNNNNNNNLDFSERFTPKLPPLTTKHTGSFYTKDAHQDYKIFHKIPESSHLLAHYDPFYSPLLSRLDSVFQQLGTTSEVCRQRLVCDMYRNPAKFAPYSNLVSAQLSRELNELRKPSSDNPEILRFFRYMKAAKDGQDGLVCSNIYSTCIAPTAPTQGSPMIETFNQINKLVQARKFN